MNTKPDLDKLLGGLKDFQRRTAHHVFDRLYGSDPVRKFLIADEVGLGKTLVARGVIAKAVHHLWDKVERIDVLYICSSHDIARQNIKRLRVSSGSNNVLPSRLTLLPTTIETLRGNKVNFVAFTPGTSFEHSSGGGRVDERVVLFNLLDRAWGIADSAASRYVLGNGVKPENFQWHLDAFVRHGRTLNQELSRDFVAALKDIPALKREFEELRGIYCRHDSKGDDASRLRRSRWINRLRKLLARVCLKALQPDLIILDEFQRFKHLLNADSEAGNLAEELFDYASAEETERARVLLLSATPYKMLSMHHESDDDHYEDLLRTLRFLDAAGADDYRLLLTQFRDCLKSLKPGGATLESLRLVKERLQKKLRRVIVRTERLALSANRGSMLVEKIYSPRGLHESDVRGYLGLQAMAELLKHGDLVEYWKAAPFLFNFMDAYKVKQAFKERSVDDASARALIETIRAHPDAFVDFDRIEAYREFAAGHPALRGLIAEALDAGAWRLLWAPPSLPYYGLSGPFSEQAGSFTKRLIFSSWHVVPKTIASVVSYEAERRMVTLSGKSAANTAEARKRRRGLLRFAQSDGRLNGMPLFLLVYPCSSFVEACDPRKFCREHGQVLTGERALDICIQRIQGLLAELSLPSDESGPADEAWYWAAPILLDLKSTPEATAAWWEREDIPERWKGAEALDEGEDDRWSEHITHAWDTVNAIRSGAKRLGRVPPDLAQVLALSALAAPANVAHRALRIVSEKVLGLKDCAAVIGKAFLTVFNQPETRELIRNLNAAAPEPHWLRVLEYCHSGCLQAVLDEYLHILAESLGGADKADEEALGLVTKEVTDVVGLRTAALQVDRIEALPYAREVEPKPFPMRVKYAMRFGDERGDAEVAATDQQIGTRKERVRAAFNSPFWPFVLCTTSVGQEGLDFHHYCHAVVHWNLPTNPVDLEQREGRVHRYKGLAVRKNVAAEFGQAALVSAGEDVWSAAFEAARHGRAPHETDLVPFWVYPGAAKVERHVLTLPFSREVEKYQELRRMLAVYRMVFGQSRQEDLLRFLLTNVPEHEREGLAAELRVDLSSGPSDDVKIGESAVTPNVRRVTGVGADSDRFG